MAWVVMGEAVRMKSWLARAVANTVVRGEARDNRLMRWSRWFGTRPAVEESRFQGPDEPYPGHWREFPEPWPQEAPSDAAIEGLAAGLEELPGTWREVVRRRDVAGRSSGEVADELGLTVEQERAVLNRARARLREHLARLVRR